MSKEAMKLAKAWFERNTYGDEAVDVYDALCEALAEQPAQQALDKMAENARELGIQMQPAQQEPVAWMYPDDYERMTTSETFCTVYSVEVGSATRGETTVALYTSPPVQRKPLTFSKLCDIEYEITHRDGDFSILKFARAIEAAHGIKENT